MNNNGNNVERMDTVGGVPARMLRDIIALGKDDGGTYDPVTGDLVYMREGYMVADPDAPSSVGEPSDTDPAYLEGLYNVVVAARERGEYVGVWRNPETGSVEVEVSTLMHHRIEAMAIGYMRRQLAIWDWEACDVITLTRD